jgi:organic hydroperoxide reductase OsmC/OhrA
VAILKVAVENLHGQVAMGRQEQDHTLLLDRPIATGGRGLGFNGGHLLLLGWGACFKSTLLAAAISREIDITSLALEIEGETAEGPARFSRVSMIVHIEGPESSESSKLIDIARKGCIVSNTLAAAADMHVELAG